MNRMTINQVKNAMKSNKYILLRTSKNTVLGINCKILKTDTVQNSLKGKKPKEETPYIGFRTCNFQEYLSHKEPFMC